MEIEKEISNSSDYKEYFSTKIIQNKDVLTKTLEHALEVRKFEIELYWKRTTYFWAFIASSFAGYFVAINSDSFKELTIIISLIGLLFSIGWYLANRGSKYWQKNWETHVDMLENDELGPLFATILNPTTIKFNKITREYPFSVSKINQILSFSIVLIWIYILSYSLDYTYEILTNDLIKTLLNCGSFLVIFIWTLVLFIRDSETGLSKELKKAVNEKQSNILLISRKK
ncbi:hypothetical protein [Saccharicrinis sp. FJH54]|uniref:RipA family octameric membrane protein n=1 Tax=Saccharicrinis sp. FJH54 TaxID=3344665 RepID=UPI0035D4745A